ncbi:MAG: VWA domain-containing protein [Thermoanaerobaculum sp.]|nr:VWA domain-containing protein [Thermoanaerobaculum sp.]MDW7968306.1 VWA domain-containing protein [Thermoanaerobaculum sp.]
MALPLAPSGLLWAQQPQTFRDQTEVTTILVPVTVRDQKGRLVAHLEREAFRFFVDGMEFPIASFWREGGLSIAYVFVVDTSGSMYGRRLNQVRAAIGEFLAALKPGDEVSLITFGAGEVHRRLRLGADPAALPPLLERLTGFGTTALYDVLSVAPRFFDGARALRRAALLFTDGVDTASQLTAEGALMVLENLQDPLYVFGIEPPPGPPEGGISYEQILIRFAHATGGRYLRVGKLEELRARAAELRRELSQRYIIAFTPSGVGEVKWRKITVKVKGPYSVVTREGYRGTLP